MKTYKLTITGTTPLLMHADNIAWADKMKAWENDPKNKQNSKAGDDRTPPWRWIGCLNHDGNVVTMPSEYIMRCLMGGAAEVQTGKGKKTFKAQSQSGVLCSEFHWPLLIKGKTVSMRDINALTDLATFDEHVESVQMLGFSLFVKRAKIGQSKHIRVRPRFDDWSCDGELVVTDEQISKTVLGQIIEISGRLKGLGDWRPGAPTPGAFGMFKAVIA